MCHTFLTSNVQNDYTYIALCQNIARTIGVQSRLTGESRTSEHAA